MIDIIPFFMLPVAFVLMFLGIQVAFAMMITAVLFGLHIFGDRVIFQFIEKIEDISSNFVFAAIPLFVFMGAILENPESPINYLKPFIFGHDDYRVV